MDDIRTRGPVFLEVWEISDKSHAIGVPRGEDAETLKVVTREDQGGVHCIAAPARVPR